MKISLNGKPHTIEAEIKVSQLLEDIGLAGKPVVVELNEEAVIPRSFTQITLQGGDKVEIITLAAGG